MKKYPDPEDEIEDDIRWTDEVIEKDDEESLWYGEEEEDENFGEDGWSYGDFDKDK